MGERERVRERKKERERWHYLDISQTNARYSISESGLSLPPTGKTTFVDQNAAFLSSGLIVLFVCLSIMRCIIDSALLQKHA